MPQPMIRPVQQDPKPDDGFHSDTERQSWNDWLKMAEDTLARTLISDELIERQEQRDVDFGSDKNAAAAYSLSRKTTRDQLLIKLGYASLDCSVYNREMLAVYKKSVGRIANVAIAMAKMNIIPHWVPSEEGFGKPYHPRRPVNEEGIKDREASLRQHGVIE